MTRPRSLALVASAAISVIGLAFLRAVPLAQIPNQSQMVTQTIGDVRFSTLRGFTLERVNPADRTDSYVMLTFDSAGRLVVSKENDYPRTLLDHDKDGIFEAEQVISDKVRNCQGLWFDGPTLYAACNEASTAPAPQPGQSGPQAQSGIFRMNDSNGDGVADTFDLVARTVGAIQEHGPHAIRRAPDGGMTTLMGNFSSPVDESLDPNSLVRSDKDVQFLPHIPNWLNSHREGIHSGLYRWLPDRKLFTVEFGGNRNAYDYAYNLAGEAFLFDSDMEWDINMPWYREVRSVHGILGGNYGYRNASGKYPEYYIDSLPPMRGVGRGSPVGVEFYTSYAYPREFFDNYFEADWSRGRLLYTALTPKGATYDARADRAEFVHGEPFNITDVEVGPDGMMYFTTGGRNTTGGVWRLRYTGTDVKAPDMTGILAVVRQPQPLSSWGWAAIERVKEKMNALSGASFASELERIARNASADTMDRVRAILELQRHGPPPSATLLTSLAADRNADVRAAAVYVAGFRGETAKAIAAAALKDASPLVRRRAAEAIVRLGQAPDRPSLAPVADIVALLNHTDRFVRWAGRTALERSPRAEWKDKVLAETNPLGLFEGMIAYVRTATGDDLQPLIDRQLTLMQHGNLSLDNKLRLYRTFMYTAAEMKGGLSPAQREKLHALLIDQFPAQDERLNREMALMLAYAGQPAAIAEILAVMPKNDDNQPLQLHYMYALRMFKEGWTPEQKLQLAETLGRAAKWRGGAQFMNFVSAMFEAVQGLYTTDQEEKLLFEKAPEFAPLTPEELAEIQKAQAASGRGRGRGGALANPVVARRMGRVLSRQEMLEEAVYQPQQKLDREEGRQLFEKNCASCHRFGAIGDDHGLAGLNLTSSPLRSSKYALLEAIMFPDRSVAAAHETTVFEMADGTTVHALVLKDVPQGVSALTREGAVRELAKAGTKARRKVKTSLMTEAMADAMNQSQWRNLLAFLTSEPPGGTLAPGNQLPASSSQLPARSGKQETGS